MSVKRIEKKNQRVMTPSPIFKREKSSLNPGQNNSLGEKEISTFELKKERRIAVSNFDKTSLDEKVKSMMVKSENKISDGTKRAHICKECGKEGQWVAIRDHIEANHLEGVSLPCYVCGKDFRSRTYLRKHKCSRNL